MPCASSSRTPAAPRLPTHCCSRRSILDACEDVPVEPVVVARRTVQRLDLGTPVEQSVAGLVTDANLLAGAARRLDAMSEESVLALAVHLGTSEHARALYLLTMATFSGVEWERERVEALHDLIQDALSHPELTGRAAANEVEHRKSEARAATNDDAVRERIAAAPREYVLSQTRDRSAAQRRTVRTDPGPERRPGDGRTIGRWISGRSRGARPDRPHRVHHTRHSTTRSAT